MHARAAVMDKSAVRRGTPGREVWSHRGGTGGSNNSGPAGHKMRPAARMYRALADMAAAHHVLRGLKKVKK